jgi:hypothetical protein
MLTQRHDALRHIARADLAVVVGTQGSACLCVMQLHAVRIRVCTNACMHPNT